MTKAEHVKGFYHRMILSLKEIETTRTFEGKRGPGISKEAIELFKEIDKRQRDGEEKKSVFMSILEISSEEADEIILLEECMADQVKKFASWTKIR